MTNEERPLYEIVEKLEAAWNNSDSVAWTALFADDADFIHVLGGHFHGRTEIERGHRTIFDTIYKGSRNTFQGRRRPLRASGCGDSVYFRQPDVVPEGRRAAHPGASYAGGGEEPGRHVENRDVSEHTGDHRRRADVVGYAGAGASDQGRYAGEVIREWKR